MTNKGKPKEKNEKAKGANEMEEVGEAAEDLAKAVANTAKENLAQKKDSSVSGGTKSKSKKVSPKESAEEREPYEWDKSTVVLTIQMFPGENGDREVVVSGRTHGDAPILRHMKQSELGNLPDTLQNVLEELEDSLPQRKIEWMKRQENGSSTKRSGTTKTSNSSPADKKQPALF